ncbi:MAG: FtsX-like permease family protein [Planctomycetota bacterium]
MFRSFLSWRYLTARRTNLIGISGILVGVGALILILSIMTGFLEQSRDTVRGSLSDLIVAPVQGQGWSSRSVPSEPERLLKEVRAKEGVRSATAHLNWFGLMTLPDRVGHNQRLLGSSEHAGYSGVHLVGIDVRTDERLLGVIAAAPLMARGLRYTPPPLQDELTTTELLNGLAREPRNGARVRNPLRPFAPPPGYDPVGRPLPRVVVGEQLFGMLGLGRGSVLELMTAVQDPTSGEWGFNNRRFAVAGTFRSGENEMDLGRIYMERGELADFLGETLSFSEVLVRLDEYDGEGTRIRDELRSELAEAGVIRGGDHAFREVRTWEEFRGNLIGAIENERVLMMIMLSLVLLVAGFTVFAILSMMVTEKRRDIGILCAIGATPKGILDTFLYIAFWDALIGATLGALIGTWAAFKIDPIERWLSDKLGVEIFNRDVYLFDHIPSIVDPFAVALIVMGAFTCALLFAAIPALRAARLDPLTALRYE